MSSDPTNTQRAPGFIWILGAFAGFALLAAVMQGILGKERSDPRAPEREAIRDEVKAAQLANVAKMGLEVGKSTEKLNKALEVLKAQKPTTSTLVVPGSPTQLKQSAAAPAPAATAIKPAEAAPAAAPAPAPAK